MRPPSASPGSWKIAVLLLVLLAAAVRIPLVFAGDYSLPSFTDEPFLVLSALELGEGLRPYGVLTYPAGPPLLLTAAAGALGFLLGHLGEALSAAVHLDGARLLALYERFFLEHYAGSARMWVTARLVSLCGGLLTVLALARFGRRRAGRGAGLAAAALLALWPAHAVLSAQGRGDVWIGLFLVLLLDESFIVGAEPSRSVLLVALWSALLVCTKNNAAVALAVPAACLWTGTPVGERLRRIGTWIGTAVVLAVVACPWLLSDTVFVVKEIARTYAALSSFAVTKGEADRSLVRIASCFLDAYGPVLLVAIPAGAIIWGRRCRWTLAAALLTPATVLLSMLSAGLFPSYYLVPISVPLLAGAGLFAVDAGTWAWVRVGLGRASGDWGAAAATGILGLALLPATASLIVEADRPDPRVEARRWIQENVPEGGTVLEGVPIGLRMDRAAARTELESLERRYFHEETPLPVPVAKELFAVEVLYRIHHLRHLLRAWDVGLVRGEAFAAYPFTWGSLPEPALEALRSGRRAWVVLAPAKAASIRKGAETGLDRSRAAEAVERALQGTKRAEFRRGELLLEIYEVPAAGVSPSGAP